MFKFFKKKEKPLQEYGTFEICVKTIYTKECSYMPTNIAYYENRIEFTIDRISFSNEKKAKKETFTFSVPITGERLLSFEIDGVPLFWDTKDMAFRRKLMPEGEPQALIPGVLLYPNEVMTMDRDFAEKELSSFALSYATLDGDRYIWYYPDGSAAPAVFEIPRLFFIFSKQKDHPLSGEFLSAHSNVTVFAPTYLEEAGIAPSIFEKQYLENLKKGATEGKPDPLAEYYEPVKRDPED